MHLVGKRYYYCPVLMWAPNEQAEDRLIGRGENIARQAIKNESTPD